MSASPPANPSISLPPAAAFVARLALAWGLAVLTMGALTATIARNHMPKLSSFVLLFVAMSVAVAIGVGITHVRRVKSIAGHADASALANRHRRQIEVPYDAPIAFDIVETAVRELPRVEHVVANRAGRYIRAEVPTWSPYMGDGSSWDGRGTNLVHVTIAPGDCCGSAVIVCEPRTSAWLDWFLVDDGANLETAETLTKSIARIVADRRRTEMAESKQTAAEKELADARLALLQAQVEPHFLYNTLANAQLLTRSDPARADKMLGELIAYLRCSLPRLEQTASTLSEELARAKAYLELMKIRMGERLHVEIDVADSLLRVELPPMVLQTLVENAIKHGLEPKPGPGTIWIRAKAAGECAEIQVADDGKGFGSGGSGTGIGLKNARERLRIAHGDAATLSISPNFPSGVTVTVRIPMEKDAS
ncbi:MAG: histidine kinase [Betaproteobacteria bacterium]|nr:histidine kinase [Betaproteobacteria bacterium]